MDNEKGVWRTVRGRRVFIRDGESLGSAMARSGKFKRSDIREGKKELSGIDRANKNRNIAKRNMNTENKIRKIEKNEHKYAKHELRDSDFKNQAPKNRLLSEDKKDTVKWGETRVERNINKYSDTDVRELRHEELQKKLADYKAKKQSNNKFSQKEQLKKEIAHEVVKAEQNGNRAHAEAGKRELERLNKQSNNKVESEYELYKRAKEHPESIDPMTENSTDWEALDEKYGKDYAVEKAQQRKSEFKKLVDESNKKKETIKNYVEKKQSNNKTNKIDYSKINVGDTFQQKINNSVYNIEVTKKNKDNYTIQATSVVENGKKTNLFGPTWISTLVEKRDKNTPNGNVDITQITNYKKKKGK